MAPTTSFLEAFRATFGDISDLPYCSGVIPLDESNATLFYRTGDKAELLNFARTTEEQLSSLAEACQQAKFGVDNKDVLDESYRKAGKLDPTEFATQFSPLTSGIVDSICQSLLDAEHSDKSINVELYKLNVYGPGSFFKAHVDTPRSDTMFGSLVVVLPTTHEGGSLIFRHRGQERTFDTAQAITSQKSPHVAFVAFFSDVEHEVSVVTSGYRVTLTYNLYFVDQLTPGNALGILPDNDPLEQMKISLEAILADPEFLPDGGLLGFGLSHKYPIKPSSTKLSALSKRLKGNDAGIKRVCEALSLNVSLKVLYKDDENICCLLDSLPDISSDYQMEEGLISNLCQQYDATLVFEFGGSRRGYYDDDDERAVPIVWAKPSNEFNSFRQEYIAYGNEATMGYAYGEVCLVAKIENFKKRAL